MTDTPKELWDRTKDLAGDTAESIRDAAKEGAERARDSADRALGQANDAAEAGRERAKELEVMLDQSWDLLHQRRARRAAGMDPDDAEVRGAAQVEGYLG